jgi:hypothetical protein
VEGFVEAAGGAPGIGNGRGTAPLEAHALSVTDDSSRRASRGLTISCIE